MPGYQTATAEASVEPGASSTVEVSLLRYDVGVLGEEIDDRDFTEEQDGVAQQDVEDAYRDEHGQRRGEKQHDPHRPADDLPTAQERLTGDELTVLQSRRGRDAGRF